MGNRNRVNRTLSDPAMDAIKSIQSYARRAGFPNVSKDSHAIDIAVIEFSEQLKSAVDKNNQFPFLTRENWK